MKDLHTHILPGMDDGAADAGESLALLRMEAEQGVTGVALTPHFYRYREPTERFLSRRERAWAQLSEALAREPEPWPELALGAEVAWVPNLNRWDELEALCLGNSRYLLLELPFTPWNGALLDQLYSLAGLGTVVPVLAHLERYMGVQKKEYIRELYRLGVPIQFSAACLLHTVERWRTVRRMEGGREYLLASDCHNIALRRPNLGPAMEAAYRHMGRERAAALENVSERIFDEAGAGTNQREAARLAEK